VRHTPELDRIQSRMQPGELTLHGFLGSDHRKLGDILEADRQLAHARDISHEQIADRLDELAARGRDLMEREVEVEERYKVTVRDDRGVLPCPWGDGNFRKEDVHLCDPQTGAQLRWNELTAHMIRAHGFYGGVGSPYRIDPAAAIQALNLQPLQPGETIEGEEPGGGS
jgi:hypothetical protein